MFKETIVIASDSAGFPLKEHLRQYLVSQAYEVLDVGTTELEEPVDYIVAATNVATTIGRGNAAFGVLCCGTGMGVSIVANKHPGVYCALVESQWTARESRNLNNANVIAMGNRVLAPSMAQDILHTFITTPFANGSDEKRKKMLEDFLIKVHDVEKRNMSLEEKQ